MADGPIGAGRQGRLNHIPQRLRVKGEGISERWIHGSLFNLIVAINSTARVSETVKVSG